MDNSWEKIVHIVIGVHASSYSGKESRSLCNPTTNTINGPRARTRMRIWKHATLSFKRSHVLPCNLSARRLFSWCTVPLKREAGKVLGRCLYPFLCAFSSVSLKKVKLVMTWGHWPHIVRLTHLNKWYCRPLDMLCFTTVCMFVYCMDLWPTTVCTYICSTLYGASVIIICIDQQITECWSQGRAKLRVFPR